MLSLFLCVFCRTEQIIEGAVIEEAIEGAIVEDIILVAGAAERRKIL